MFLGANGAATLQWVGGAALMSFIEECLAAELKTIKAALVLLVEMGA